MMFGNVDTAVESDRALAVGFATTAGVNPIEYAPTTAEVASAIMARTRDEFGNLIGDFNDSTKVNNSQAVAAINSALDEISEEIGLGVGSDLLGPAKRAVIQLAAANIEMSFWPEESNTANSVYDKLMARYNKSLERLSDDTGEAEEEQVVSGEGGGFGSFPAPSDWESRLW